MKLDARCLVVFSLATFAACDDHDHDHDHGGDVFAEFCEHLEQGPAETVAATADAEAAPSADAEHTRFDVTLVSDGSGQFAGYVQRAIGSTDQIIALDAAVPYTVFGPDGNEVPMHHDVSDQDGCSLVISARHFEMPIGTARIAFGPTTVESFSMVIEASDHGAHDHD